MLTYITIFLLVFVLAITMNAYYRANVTISNLEHYNLIVNNFISTLDDGFYLWDEKKCIEKFSPNLQLVLNTVFYSFEEFANFFEQSDQLKHNFTEAKRINKSFTINLKGKETEIYCCCYGRSIVDEKNNIVGIILWIQNITNYQLIINNLKRENIKLRQNLSDYIEMFNTAPFPIWKRDNDLKIRKYNSFYLNLIQNNRKIELFKNYTSSNQESSFREETQQVIIDNERKFYQFVELPIANSKELLGYGNDITENKKITNKLKNCVSIKKDLLENVSSAVAVYNHDSKLIFYNHIFSKFWQLSPSWLNKYPTYSEILLKLYKANKLISKKNFDILNKQQQEFFGKLSNTYYDFFKLKNGITLKVLVIPDSLDELIFIYEDITNSIEENINIKK